MINIGISDCSPCILDLIASFLDFRSLFSFAKTSKTYMKLFHSKINEHQNNFSWKINIDYTDLREWSSNGSYECSLSTYSMSDILFCQSLNGLNCGRFIINSVEITFSLEHNKEKCPQFINYIRKNHPFIFIGIIPSENRPIFSLDRTLNYESPETSHIDAIKVFASVRKIII